MIRICLRLFSIKIPVHQLTYTHSRSSGPGGQNVNKVNSKVDIRFNVDEADWIPDEAKQRLKQEWAHHINKEGQLFLQSQSKI